MAGIAGIARPGAQPCGTVEKWILRQALAGLLPESVLERPKSKFWQGAGVGELLAEHARKTVSDDDFRSQRRLPNGWIVNSKEELFYYRLFPRAFRGAARPGMDGADQTRAADVGEQRRAHGRPCRAGDRVELANGKMGDVIDVGLRGGRREV